EVTTSYGGGTSRGPQAIFEASKQVDLFDLDVERPYEPGIFMRSVSETVQEWNHEGKKLAEAVIALGGKIESNQSLARNLSRVNELSVQLNSWVYQQVQGLLHEGKVVGLVGGDHSTPFGSIQAHAERFSSLGLTRRDRGFGILHFDAHSDTRIAYEGFEHSHASIMYNVLEQIPAVTKLVQVGIRDICEQEMNYVQSQGDRVRTYFDRDMALSRFRGETFEGLANRIVEDLPSQVYVSFDIDGLDPRYCPHTGTPVPGGLEFNEATTILRQLVASGRTIVGFDLNEVAPGPEGDEWDANCGARLLYKLIAFTLASQGKRTLRFE
ncbi:MAG: agmatinase family protein, partial [Bdellovibrionales bacterium]|nr:agmatinase family protein [Bdellovibrionales bacterium]